MILLHGQTDNRAGMLGYANLFLRHGYHALALTCGDMARAAANSRLMGSWKPTTFAAGWIGWAWPGAKGASSASANRWGPPS